MSEYIAKCRPLNVRHQYSHTPLVAIFTKSSHGNVMHQIVGLGLIQLSTKFLGLLNKMSIKDHYMFL